MGLVEQQTGLPIFMGFVQCPHAAHKGSHSMDFRRIALDFHDKNCVGCEHRNPVRFPNISEIVGERDRHQQLGQERQKAEKTKREQEREVREELRNKQRDQTSPGVKGVLDLVSALDETGTKEASALLLAAAQAAPGAFRDIQDHLYALLQSDEPAKAQPALQVLNLVADDRRRLGQACLVYLGASHSSTVAAEIAASEMTADDSKLIRAAMGSICEIASPTELIPGQRLDSRPAALLKAYDLFPDTLESYFSWALSSQSDWTRAAAARALRPLFAHKPTAIAKTIPVLAKSVEFTESRHGYGARVSEHAVRAIVEALRQRPSEADELLQEAISAASEDGREKLFGAYTEVLRFARREAEDRDVEPERVCLQRLIATVVSLPRDERLSDAARSLSHLESRLLKEASESIEHLLGATALMATELEKPSSPLLEPKLNALTLLEKQNERTRLSAALRDVTQLIGQLASRFPAKCGTALIEMLPSVHEKDRMLRSTLVRALGACGRSPDGLRLVLPQIYASMLDPSVAVRAAGVEAYTAIAGSSDDLPDLVHETFLVLLSDSYVAVHGRALQALLEVTLPQKFVPRALRSSIDWLATYGKNPQPNSSLKYAIRASFRLSSKTDVELHQNLVKYVVGVCFRMEAYEALEILRWYWGDMKADPRFPRLLIHLAVQDRVSSYQSDDVIQMLRAVPSKHLRPLHATFVKRSDELIEFGTGWTEELCEILCDAGMHATAAAMIDRVLSRLESSEWDKLLTLRASVLRKAIEIEIAASEGDNARLVESAEEVRLIAEKYRREDERREKKRGLFNHIPPPG
ncbi:MAG: hypothetical protein RMA76_19105 [Deltaproteobacteria bacterium]|jgi:hypothetical protein